MNESDELDWSRLRGDLSRAREANAQQAEEELRQVQDRLFSVPANAKPLAGSSHRRSAWLLLFAASLAVAAAVGARLLPSRPLSFETGVEGHAGQVGAFLSTPAAGTLPVLFSDGSKLTMASASRVRIVDTTAEGATVVIEEGSLSAAVVRRPASRWRMTAGPFTVLVTGTAFDLRWLAAQGTFELDLHQGHVTVVGPTLLADGGRHMSAGEHLRVVVGPEPEPATAGEVKASLVKDMSDDDGPTSTRPRVSPSPRRPHKVPAVATRASWKPLALGGHYADALTAAEADDFAALCQRESAENLLLLADTAHFGGSTDRAVQAFHSLRARFAGTHEAAVAGFSLGRIAYDEHRSFVSAAQWFQSYLSEEPRGTLAREASGRLIEAYRAAGNISAAQASASSYLAIYPTGPHSGLARSIVSP